MALAQVWEPRRRTLLADVDEVAPGLARRLHLALHPHLLTALDGLRSAGFDPVSGDDGDLRDASLSRPLGSAAELPFDVLVGLADPRDWPLGGGPWSSSTWARIWRTSPGSWTGTARPGRRLARADQLVGVCEATPRGALRFLDWLVDATALAPDRAVDVVVNRAPRGAFQRGKLADALHEHAGPRLASISFVPDDRRAAAAAWDGRLVPPGRFLRAVAEMAARIAGSGLAAEAVAR